MSSKVYNLYLSTLTPSNYQFPVVDKTNLANVKWNVDWRDVFGDLCGRGDCLVKLSLQSKEVAAATLTYDAHIGSVRCNFSTAYQNTTQGVNIGILGVANSPTGTAEHLISCNTLQDRGTRIRIPNATNDFNISLYDMAATLLVSADITDYQAFFQFEIIEESIV